MYRYFLAFSGLIAILLLPACGSTQIGGAASSSGTPVSAAPTSGAAPGAAPPTSAPGAATAAPTIRQPPPAIKLKQVAGEFNAPVFVTHVGDDSSRMFVVEKKGTIAILRGGRRDPTPFLDISDLVTSSGSEQGLLGLAFHPDYATNGRFFV